MSYLLVPRTVGTTVFFSGFSSDTHPAAQGALGDPESCLRYKTCSAPQSHPRTSPDTRLSGIRWVLRLPLTIDYSSNRVASGNTEAHGEHPFCVEVQLVIAPAHKCHAGDSM